VSDDASGWALPAFDAKAALLTLKRQLRDCRLAERGHAFELRGKTVVELALDGEGIAAKLARKLAQTPEWDKVRVTDAHAQRKLLDEVKKRLERWEREE
jgi:hypothetical protein